MSFFGPILLAICGGLLLGAGGELIKLLLKNEGVRDMECKATTQRDGSKFCRECGVSWDMDEKKEDCCPKLRKEPYEDPALYDPINQELADLVKKDVVIEPKPEPLKGPVDTEHALSRHEAMYNATKKDG